MCNSIIHQLRRVQADEEGDSEIMSPKFTKMQTGEKIIEEHTDDSAWLTRKMKLCSETVGVSKYIEGTGSIHGTVFLTNLRIIFESLDGNTSESTAYEEIESIGGKDGGFNPGEVNIYKKNGDYIEYLLYCGGKFSNTVNNQFFNADVIRSRNIKLAQEREKHLDYDGAIQIYEENNMPEEAGRIRKLKAEQGTVKVTQKVVHGDEITKTDIRDSVISKSNVGAGGKSKSEELREAKALFDDGIIDEDEFKQMKKEILEK